MVPAGVGQPMSATTLGLVIAIGLPVLVILGTIFWPERVRPDLTVETTRQRYQREDDQPRAP